MQLDFQRRKNCKLTKLSNQGKKMFKGMYLWLILRLQKNQDKLVLESLTASNTHTKSDHTNALIQTAKVQA